MKVIDLLNKIANGEEVPKKIKYRDWLYEFEKDCNDYLCQYDSLLYRENDDVRQFLNDEVEIIEEKEMCHKCHKYPVEYNQTWCEFCLGISKEEKKIPEKLVIYDDSINWCCNGRVITNTEKDIIDKINEIIDYLKSKGE